MRNYDIKILDDKGKLTKTITIKPVKRKDLADLVETNKTIIESFLKYNGGIGSALADDTVWIAMEKIAKLCPVLGQEEVGFDLSLIEGDYETLSKLFFTINDVEDTLDSTKTIKPSIISTLNYLDFTGEMGKAFKKLREDQERRTGNREEEKIENIEDRLIKLDSDHLLILLELFPNQVSWLWNNFDIKLLKELIDSAIELKKPKNNVILSSSNSFKEINSKIEKEKEKTKDWLNKNKNLLVNGKSLEDLANFKF